MITVVIEYLLDDSGIKALCLENNYSDLLAGDISRSGIQCPDGHTNYPSVELVLGFDENRKVNVKEYNNSCCDNFTVYLQDNLKNSMNF